MTQATRRERLRAETEREIRGTARDLLIAQGREAVTLRAIARELGITAPALYRYYDSREDLLLAVCEDIAHDLASELRGAIDVVSNMDIMGRVFAACRGFRRWALSHPHEFALVFATPADDIPGVSRPLDNGEKPVHDQFARVFLSVAIPLFASQQLAVPAGDAVSVELRADLVAFRTMLGETIGEDGDAAALEALGIGALYLMLQCWARLYGHIALEVFGQLKFALTNAEPLFESMLLDLARDAGLISTS